MPQPMEPSKRSVRPRREAVFLESQTGPMTLLVTGGSVRCSFWDDGRLLIQCRVEAEPNGFTVDGDQREELRRRLAELEETRLKAALERLQTWGADCLGLGAKAGLLSPGIWRELEERWPQTFPSAA